MSSVTMIEQHPGLKRSGNISVKPYFDPEKNNMGLEKYNMSLYDQVYHEEQLACVDMYGVKRYITGLNEYAPEVKSIVNPEERAAKIKEIRTVVAEVERQLKSNDISPDDEHFWDKVQLLKPDNNKFWDHIKIRCGNQPVFLDPVKDPYDLIKLYAIEAGGFSIIAKSYDEARKMAVPPKFYLDKSIETVAVKTELKKMRNKALSMLQTLFDKNNKLMYVAKVLDINSAQYKKNTPNDVVYDNMDKYINGEGIERNKLRAAKTFIEAGDLDMADLKLRALVKDAAFYKIIGTKADGFIYHLKSNTMLGKNPSEIVEFLKNPLNESALTELTRIVEAEWAR
jgi:hypothetical protein